jgi:heme exporter protein B
VWWIVHKDLVTELRARRVWPAMFLLGTVVAFVFSLQMDVLPHQKQSLLGGLLWLAIFFAGMTAIDRSFAAEREDGCWDALKLYPLSPAKLYWAKLLVNVLALAALECLLIPLFFLLSGLPWRGAAYEMLLIAVLGNVGIVTVGTLISALAASMPGGGSLLAFMILPMVIPVVLAAAEATCLVVEGGADPMRWRWMQLLGTCDVVFFTAGTILFEYAIED